MDRPLDDGTTDQSTQDAPTPDWAVAQEYPQPEAFSLPQRTYNVDASPSRLRGSLRTGRAFVAATAPKIAARLPVTVTVARKPAPADQAQLVVLEQATVVPIPAQVVVGQPVPMPYRVIVPKPPWNVFAILALPLAMFLPLAGFFAGMLAVRQIRRTGERGAVLANLAWIFGLTNSMMIAFGIAVAAIAYAVKMGVEDGIRGAIVSIVTGILHWLFG
jgi:hypothetical protein